jgi:hypothetical protein
MNKQTKLIIEIVLGLAFLLLASASTLGQEQPPQAGADQVHSRTNMLIELLRTPTSSGG